jgi:AAA+ superfamily predicted ATPase
MRSGNPVILLTANLSDLHQTIRAASSKFEAIRAPLPDQAARLEFIRQYREKNDKTTWKPTPEQLANATAGLSLIHIEDIFLRAEQEGSLTWDLVRERKQDIIWSTSKSSSSAVSSTRFERTSWVLSLWVCL